MQLFNRVLITVLMLLPALSHSEIRTSLRADTLNFLSPDYTASTKNFSFVGAHVRTIKPSDSAASIKKNSKNQIQNQRNTSSQNPGAGKMQVLENKPEKIERDAFNIDFTGAYAVGNSVLSFLNFREVFYTYEIDDESAIHMGRKLNDWSALDSSWNFGVFQPQFEWNQLAPENQGLTGFFYTKDTSAYNLNLFATPLFIPDQGASYEIKDGQFQSGNPFFQPPPQNIKFQGQVLPIDYEINKPETTDVVFQSQLGAQFRVGEKLGYFANASAIFKPSNQLALAYKGVLVTTRVRVDVTPKTYLENAYALDMGYKANWGHFILSGLYSKPQNPEFDSTQNAPTFEPSLMVGPQFLYKFRPFQFTAAYVTTSGGAVTDVGPDASADRASLSERFIFKDAALLSASYGDIFFKTFRWDSQFSFQFSSKEAYRKIRFKNSIDFKGPWALWVDLILIDTDSNIKTGYESFKNLDQVWIGASYDL